MENIKERIYDLILGEIKGEQEKKKLMELIGKDPGLKKYYQNLKKEREMIKGSFSPASEDLLESNRTELFDTININERDTVKKIRINSIIPIFGKQVLKYAAVILLTFYATMYHFGGKETVKEIYPETIKSGVNTSGFRTVSTGSTDMGSYMKEGNYIVENLEIDENGEDVVIDFNISTDKTIKGKKNDPDIISALKYLIAHENNPGVKLRTLNAMDEGNNDEYKDALIKTALNDENAFIRRKAIKIIGQNPGDNDIREALYNVVLNDKDQTNRIEALNSLESAGGDYADKALRNISDEDNDYFRFKAANLENK